MTFTSLALMYNDKKNCHTKFNDLLILLRNITVHVLIVSYFEKYCSYYYWNFYSMRQCFKPLLCIKYYIIIRSDDQRKVYYGTEH